MSTNQETIARTVNCGELRIQFQYIDDEPAMVLSSARFRAQRRRAWVIPLESAWKYVDNDNGEHQPYMVHASYHIAEMLGLGVDNKTRFRISEAILNNLEELINMPPVEFPKPPGHQVKARINGGEEFCFEMPESFH